MATIVEGQRRGQEMPTEPEPEFIDALRAEYPPEDDDDPVLDDGDAARTALLLLAEDEQFRTPIEHLIDGPAPRRLGFGETAEVITLAACLILALQTGFEIDLKTRYLRMKIEKKPTSEKLLKPLVKKLLSAFPD